MCRTAILITAIFLTAAGPVSAHRHRQTPVADITTGSTTPKKESWLLQMPAVLEFERRLMRKKMTGAPLAKRARVYAGIIEGGRRYIIGMLFTPQWLASGNFNPAQRDAKLPETWEAHIYIVPRSNFPSRVYVVPPTDCEIINIAYDVQARTLRPTSCVK